MGAVNANPSDQNLLQGSKFALSFIRLPYISFFIQSLNLPGIETTPLSQVNPFIDAPIPADKMRYEMFTMTFLVDEPMWSWTSIDDWLKGITFPETFQQYQNLSIQQRIQMSQSVKGKPQYSDATLVIMTNKNNPILTVNFTDMFPVSLTGLEFSTQDTAQMIKTATATFAFTNRDYNRQI